MIRWVSGTGHFAGLSLAGKNVCGGVGTRVCEGKS